MIKSFFFDLDGTLVDTYEADFLAYRDAIQGVAGIEITQADFEKTHGQEMRVKLDRLAPGLDEAAIQQVGNDKKRHYQKYVHLTVADETLINFLTKFSKTLSMVLVTSAKKDNALRVLSQHKLTDYFDYIVFGDEVAKPKPDPEPYLLALQNPVLRQAK